MTEKEMNDLIANSGVDLSESEVSRLKSYLIPIAEFKSDVPPILRIVRADSGSVEVHATIVVS